MSLVYVILLYYTDSLFSRIVALTGIVFVGVISFILIESYIKRTIVSKSRFPICHDMQEEFSICARCKGFYGGFALFGIMLAIRSTIYIDVLRTIGLYPYLIVTFLVIVSVPLHGALRRLKIIESTKLLHVVGFIFSSSIYLIGSLLVFLLYGV